MPLSSSRKRRRTIVSCSECHRRKQKCDRRQPCFNCVRRGKESICDYNSVLDSCQPEPTRSNGDNPRKTSNGIGEAYPVSPAGRGVERVSIDIQNSAQELGYASQSHCSSMSLLRESELDRNDSPSDSRSAEKPVFKTHTLRKYTDLIFRLPPQASVDILIQTYFSFVNWQYDLLDKQVFQAQLKAWRGISYSDLHKDLAVIAPDTLVFPALLLQVLAQALLVHSPCDQTINGLLVMAHMTFHDLGAEYSNAGANVMELLGKGSITTTVVQAGLLRASFLKSTGRVVDAWHVLGAAIRDAQEIGLHTGPHEHRQHLDGVERDIENASIIGVKLWVVLHIWDAHMAVVLGRPMATDLQLESFAHKIRDDERRRDILSHWKTEDESPRPFDVIIAGYIVAYRYFAEIHRLENHDTELDDHRAVERIHTTIISNLDLLPSWCRLKTPCMRFDGAVGCHWLPAARETLYSLINLVLLTLHRPHIFSRTNSRMEAMKAGLSILRAQDCLSQLSSPDHCNLFTPVYHSFDAIVLVGAICLTFPCEDDEQEALGFQALERGVERLDVIGKSNRMARIAHGVAASLYSRLIQRFGTVENIEGATDTRQIPLNDRRHSSSLALSEFSFEAVPPPRPTHELFDDHLSSAHDPITGRKDTIPVDPCLGDNTDMWNFEGDFSDSSFWGVLNDLHPDT